MIVIDKEDKLERLNSKQKEQFVFEKKDFYNNKSKHKKIILIISIIVLLFVVAAVAIVYFAGVPIVNYKGEEKETIRYGETYVDKGIDVYTKFKNINNNIIVSGEVDTSKIGNYIITYKVPYFNDYKTYMRMVSVIDDESPKLILNGDEHFNLTYGEEYQEPGYIATDNYDGDITQKVVVSQIDVDENNYEKHYIVKDSSGNETEVIRYIKIIDNVAPKISLRGKSVVSILTGSTYNEQGATAQDNKDGDISSQIQISGEVDTSKDGTYIVTYTVSDSNGNESKEQRKVIVGKSEVKGVIYLTFDDGPSTSITPKILDILKEKGVNATFFILNYSDSTEHLVKREIEEGNSVGIHGYSHNYSEIYSSADVCYDNIIKLQQKIYNSTGVLTKVLRFPGGSSNTVSRKYCPGVMTDISKKVLDEGFKYYDWNVASGDSGDVKTKEGVYKNVTTGLKPGRNNIVLMHDFSGNHKTLEALPEIIDYGLSNGYVFDVITTDTEMVTQKIQN